MSKQQRQCILCAVAEEGPSQAGMAVLPSSGMPAAQRPEAQPARKRASKGSDRSRVLQEVGASSGPGGDAVAAPLCNGPHRSLSNPGARAAMPSIRKCPSLPMSCLGVAALPDSISCAIYISIFNSRCVRLLNVYHIPVSMRMDGMPH